MAKIDVAANEQVLMQAPLATLHAGLWQNGTGVLTTERFMRRSQGYKILSAFGVIGTLINQALPPGPVDIDIPLSSITTIGRGKLGLLKDVLLIVTSEGKTYQLTPRYESWIAPLQNALQQYSHATLVPDGAEKWQVKH
jgi:hypothetical protein